MTQAAQFSCSVAACMSSAGTYIHMHARSSGHRMAPCMAHVRLCTSATSTAKQNAARCMRCAGARYMLGGSPARKMVAMSVLLMTHSFEGPSFQTHNPSSGPAHARTVCELHGWECNWIQWAWAHACEAVLLTVAQQLALALPPPS